MAPSTVDLAFTRWRNNLIDLSRRNPLLSLRPTRSSYLEIQKPAVETLFNSVVIDEKTWRFFLPAMPRPETTTNQEEPTASPAAARPRTSGEESTAPAGPYDHTASSLRRREESLNAWKSSSASATVASANHDDTPRGDELLTQESDPQRLVQTLSNLHRRARADFRERGLHILHLACGVLEWRDPDDEPMRSPLLLVPVALERHSLREPFMLKPTEDDPWLNPALAARLKLDFEFRLPDAPLEWESNSFDAYMQAVAAVVSGLPGWNVKAEAVLAPFSFHKGVIYQDLQDHAERVQGHPLVQALAGVAERVPRFEPPREDALDQQDPAAALHILDADASQRLALEAAARGGSFVLIGPPGTGKSQTIANLIADRIARGQKVLFVSEKMAALEVVEQRLHRAGLGDCLLELHSHKANKRAVVKELARRFEDLQRPADAATPADDGMRLRERQQQLNAYVRALHQRRAPINKSAWEVLADLPGWRDVPMAPLQLPLDRQGADASQGLVVAEVTQAKLDELQQLLARAQNLWRIGRDGAFPWTGFKADRFTLQLRDEIASLIDKACQRGEKVVTTAAQVGDQFEISASAEWLLRLDELLQQRPAPVRRSWLADENLEALMAEAKAAAARQQTLRAGRQPLTERYGEAIWKLETGLAERIAGTWRHAAELLAPGDDSGSNLLALQKRLRGWAADSQQRLPSWHSDLRALEKWLGITLTTGAGASRPVTPGHDGFDPSPHTLKLFLRLTHLCHSDNPPERTWFDDPAKLRAAQEQIVAARPDFTKYRQNREKLLQVYTEAFFDLELGRIAAGYAGRYQSWFRMFNGQYRRDRRALARRSRQGETPPTAAEDVAVGRDVLALKGRLESESPQRWQKLGRYERGLDTDLDAADKGARIAVEAVDIARQLGCATLPAKLTEALASGAPADKIRAAVRRLQESFGAWWHETEELAQILPMGALPSSGAALEDSALSAVVSFARQLQDRLNPLATLTDPVLQSSRQPPANMAALVQDLRQRDDLLRHEAEQETEAQAQQARFGELFQGLDTHWDRVQAVLGWAQRLRHAWALVSEDTSPTPPSQTFLIMAAGERPAPSFRELRAAHDQFRQALHALETRFDAPGPQCNGKSWRDLADDKLVEHLRTLRDRIGALADGIEWRQLPERFWHLGLAKFWHALVQLEQTDVDLVQVFHKAFWSRWLEWIFQEDPALARFQRDEHERILAEFRALDRGALQSAPARVLHGARAAMGALQETEVALLMKEAHKKTRHLPLRRLFEAIPRLLLQLKPCMLMSPLSVSQFLPADPAAIGFDLVVFDEASQIVPEDALGAIARGRQVIVTGDNRQLPPTLFFQQFADEAEEGEEDPGLFESVLDAALGAGFPQQWLRWHYRSQHEHLIAFSNERIYENRLVTFPGAVASHPDLGVQFHNVPDGRYDRGGRRDNQREAQVVADLVLEHFRRNPEKSLGVIAFSFAQMEAIEDELERRLADAPELEKLLRDDRLEGFFVKNLETVQGDERDVILLSVGYGPDDQGKIVLNFGPLNRLGGERRLNVAVTRARQKLVVVSSIRAVDIARASAPGLQMLQQYLDYAEHGIGALRPAIEPSPDSPSLHALEADVRAELELRGFKAVPQVGCASYRIDLAVLDPQRAERYLLGIEFDGASYQQAATARDRDRLRHEVLTRLGWKLHRIWSPNWLLRREEEVRRLEHALGDTTAPNEKPV